MTRVALPVGRGSVFSGYSHLLTELRFTAASHSACLRKRSGLIGSISPTLRRYSFCMRSLVGLPQGKHFGHVKDYWECFVRRQNTVGHHALERVTRSRMVVSSWSSSNAFSGDSYSAFWLAHVGGKEPDLLLPSLLPIHRDRDGRRRPVQ